MHMTEKNKHVAAYLSWRSAWRMRCCPPDDLLYGETTKELTEHLQFCPWCKEERDTSNNNPNFPILQKMDAEKEKALPEPGQLWSIKQSLGNWGPKGRYYSPPLVVIVEVTATSVTVFQSYGDMALAGSDDLPFQTDLIGFSQPWNRYSLRIDDLDMCYGVVSYIPKKEFLPSQRLYEQSAETGSLFWFFRQMEVETGYFFASQAIQPLMFEHEELDVEITADILNLLKNDLTNMESQLLNLGLIFPDHPLSDPSVIDLLTCARAPDGLLPLAAADCETSSEYALSFTLKNEKITSVEVTGIHITTWKREGPLLHVSGNLTDIVPGNLQAFFRLTTNEQHFFPIPGEYGIENDFFWALFQVEDKEIEEGECIVRIITDGK